jgi:aquaporin Z
MRILLTEAIGTFFLVLTIGLCVVGQQPLAPIFIGSSLMVMVYMGGHISGGHYNPAVTLAVWLRGKLAGSQVGAYWGAQLTGAILAALAVRAILGATFAPAPGEGASIAGALLVETLFTFALALVVLNTATARATEGNSYFGLAIGFTITIAAAAGGAVSGGAFNPAVGVGPILVHTFAGSGSLGDIWLYIVGPLIGGGVAAAVFRIQNPAEVAVPATRV